MSISIFKRVRTDWLGTWAVHRTTHKNLRFCANHSVWKAPSFHLKLSSNMQQPFGTFERCNGLGNEPSLRVAMFDLWQDSFWTSKCWNFWDWVVPCDIPVCNLRMGSVRLEPSSNGSPFISIPVCTNLRGEAALCEGLDMISSSTIAVNIYCSISSVAVQTDALEVELRSFWSSNDRICHHIMRDWTLWAQSQKAKVQAALMISNFSKHGKPLQSEWL